MQALIAEWKQDKPPTIQKSCNYGISKIDEITKRLNKYAKIKKTTAYKCDICKDKGVLTHFDGDENYFSKDCICKIEENNKERLERSGLSTLFSVYTFENYIANEGYQKMALSRAYEFLNQTKKPFFYIGGQVGAGKTHLCTAICSVLIKKYAVRYVEYRKTILDLKALVFDNHTEYNAIADRLRNISVLYIDDLFKTAIRGESTNADIEHIFNIVNYRYNNNLITLFSSEKLSNELLEIDEGLGSRIVEKAIIVNIGRERIRNYRCLC